jgi:hypothetical protein
MNECEIGARFPYRFFQKKGPTPWLPYSVTGRRSILAEELAVEAGVLDDRCRSEPLPLSRFARMQE